MKLSTDNCQLSTNNGKEPVGAVLVCGGGVAGIQASLDLSAAGYRVCLVEENPTIGGTMARLDKTFPTGDCATCIISPKLVECMRDQNIDVMTMTDVVKLEGEPGNFKATLRRRPRYVDLSKCKACGDCSAVCPVEMSSRYEAGLAGRKAIDRPFAQASPNAFFITKRERAACSSGCPIDTGVQAYVALIAVGKFQEAAENIRRDNPLPSICGRVCFHPCETGCNRGQLDESVNIRALKRFALDQFPDSEPPRPAPASGKRVAIIGSGPAGLAAAHGLALAGHGVEVFESLPVLGGMLAVGIPDYRLPPEVLRHDLVAIESLGVQFHVNTEIAENPSLTVTRSERFPSPAQRERVARNEPGEGGQNCETTGVPPTSLTPGPSPASGRGEFPFFVLHPSFLPFDAVFVATGAHQSRKLDIPGEDCQGVIHGVDFLRQVALSRKGVGNLLCEAPEGPFRQEVPDPFSVAGKQVVVVGGGNTAIDAARTAVRLGAAVTLVYRRSRNEMPAEAAEVDAALAEGVAMHYLAAPVRVVAESGRVCAIECVRMELGQPDASGRRRPLPVAGSEFRIAAETLIPAVSQSSDRKLAELLGLRLTDAGTIAADELTMATSAAGIFSGGDVVLGPSSVIDAIAHGKRAALAIDNYLSGHNLDRGLKPRTERANPLSQADLKELRRKTPRTTRVAPGEILPGQRVAGFGEVEQSYTAEQARQEAQRCLNCGGCCECLQCVKACQPGAIIHDEQEQTVELEVGAVLLTPGFEAFDARRRGEFGFGYAANVLTNVQFERMLSASGPTQGHIRRPSDGQAPRRLAFIQCVGSRDSGCDNDYCSSVCCMAATKEAILAKEHEPGLEVTVFYLDLRAFGKDFDRYCERAKREGVRYVRSFISTTYEMPDSGNLRLVYFDPQRKQVEDEFDMVVLSLGLEPSASLVGQAERLGVDLNRWGFALTNELHPLDTSRPGVFVGGAFQEPKDIPDTVMQASAAAARAMALLQSARGSRVKTKSYPPERDVTDEPPRVGVFVCHCGSNIAGVVDVPRVVAAAAGFAGVALAEHAVYTCADDSQEQIKQKIAEYRLNRVVIASCTPRTHEPIFRDTLRDAGLNPFLLEMANIRDQCSWVHSADAEQATLKAIDLVRMSVGRAARLRPLVQEMVPVNRAALVVGGGIAGMTAAVALAEQGFPVHLVEKDGELGGTSRQIHATLDGQDVQALLADTIRRVESSPRITVHRGATVSKVEGHMGGFHSQIASAQAVQEVKHGVVILATGATEQKPESFGYGRDPRVLTQLELSDRLGRGELSLPAQPTVVMIQCVEQRDERRPYCSRVCCTTAVKNALAIKARFPGARVMVLYRDMRTYGFREAAYREAREKGVLFVRYEPEQPPRLEVGPGKGVGNLLPERPSGCCAQKAPDPFSLRVEVVEPALGRTLAVEPDLVVLAAPLAPRADRQTLSELLRVPLNADGFFLEAHMKLRPVDFASEGLFLCGTAHAPKFISESIAQAHAVAARAASILSKKNMPVGGQTAWVDPEKCISCMTCVHVCPYRATQVGRDNKAEVQGVVCMGCGSCTAECPARAITLRHYADAQILGAIDGLLGSDYYAAPLELAYPEQVGVAVPRWHRG